MKRLSGTDSLLLAMETASWHQHVGGLTVLEPGPRGLSFEDILASVTERIGYAPKFTWRLATTPLGLDRPVWVDEPAFDVRRHVHRIGVPSPGGAQEVGEACGTLLSSQLDRSRPLWEIWVLDGLAGGRVGILMKYHHCLVDGANVAGPRSRRRFGDIEVVDWIAYAVAVAPADVNLTAYSYDGRLSLGLMATPETMPDPAAFLGRLQPALNELLEVVAREVSVA